MLRDQRGRCRTPILPCQEPSGGCTASAPLPAAEGWYCPQSLLSRQIISLGSVSSALSSHPDDELTSQPAGCTIPAWWCTRAICQHRKQGGPLHSESPPVGSWRHRARLSALLPPRSGRHQAVPALQRLHHQDERRELQPYDLRRVRLRVLLALHEGDLGPALPQVGAGAGRGAPLGAGRRLAACCSSPCVYNQSAKFSFLTQRCEFSSHTTLLHKKKINKFCS